MSAVEEFFRRLTADGLIDTGELAGCSDAEIDRVTEAQGAGSMPASYRDFLRIAGRGSGALLRGSDYTFDDLLTLKAGARALLVENDEDPAVLDGTLVFLMHQGYFFSYFPAEALTVADPPVLSYEEGGSPASKSTSSFLEYLSGYERTLRAIRARAGEHT